MLSAMSYFDCLRDVKIPGELGTREYWFVTLSLLGMLFALSRAVANYHVIR